MTSVSGTTSPRWDNRNQGFISPSQLQQWKQQEEQRRQSLDLLPPSPRPQQVSASPPASPPAQSRISSSFSIFRSRQQNVDPASTPATLSSDTIQSPDPYRQQDRSSSFDLRPRSPLSSQQTQQAPMSPTRGASPQPEPSSPKLSRSMSSVPHTPAAQLHPEIRSVVQLTMAHAHKVYFSGPLVRKIERQPDGQRPTKGEDWRDVWAQLGGTTLSVWDMQEIEEASKQGKQVPPAYLNVMDAFVNVLGSVTMPATNISPPKKYQYVFTLNTAGSNMFLFSCPTPQALISWTAALRLSAWEKSRLEEIYTAHLIRITLNDGRDAPTPLVHGHMEGWVRIRVSGQTDWKRLWMIVTAGVHPPDGSPISSTDHGHLPGPTQQHTALRKKRVSNLFTRDRSPQRIAPVKPLLQLFITPKPKDRKKAVLTMHDISQAFAVYPERPELISRSTLMKLEGLLEEEVASSMKSREGWLLVMPELEGPNNMASEMLKWIISIHDAFELYGRPRLYSWDPRDPRSMMFAYPIGPHRDLLFLDREFAETTDPREDRTAYIRRSFNSILIERMQGPGPGSESPGRSSGRLEPSGFQGLNTSASRLPQDQPPLPSLPSDNADGGQQAELTPRERLSMQLPPLDFDSSFSEQAAPPEVPDKRPLTPISEQSRDPRRLLSDETNPPRTSQGHLQSITIPENTQKLVSVFGQPVVTSPVDVTSPASGDSHQTQTERKESRVQDAAAAGSRPESKVESRSDHSMPQVHPVLEKALASQNASEKAQSSEPETDMRSSAGPSRAVSPTGKSTSSMYPLPSTMQGPPLRPPSRTSVMASPHSLASPATPSRPETAPQSPVSPATASPTRGQHGEADDILGEAGALYYMQQFHKEKPPITIHRGRPPPEVVTDDEDESDSDSAPYVPRAPIVSPLRTKHTSPPRSAPSPAPSSPSAGRRTHAMASASRSQSSLTTPEPAIPAAASRTGVIRKPSGARAPTVKRSAATRNSVVLDHPDEQDDEPYDDEDMGSIEQHDAPAAHPPIEDPDADALAALTFLEQEEHAPMSQPSGPQKPTSPSSIPEVVETPASPSARAAAKQSFRSSFAPSRQAAERKAKAQAQQAAQQAAVNRPGRAYGKKRNVDRGAWGESSDEEEEEEEEEDDEDADSDVEPPPRMAGRSPQRGTLPPSGSLNAYPENRGLSPARSVGDVSAGGYSPRRTRDLPQVPPGQRMPDEHYEAPMPRRMVSDQFSDAGRFSYHPGGPRLQPSPQPQLRPTSEYPTPPAQRHTIWSQVLDSGKSAAPEPSKDTFIQMEPPATTMTKAFAPHGLLSAGLQDKHDRSAKRQEELARESGASLINVPNKPPPPQTGLLGAVTAHERERKREGGLGAALTERERDKRMAEDRQRKLDEFQRQQLDQMQQGGSMYGGMMPQFTGYNPMMMNPMMMGMNPMMTGGWGFPGMMPGYANPQQLFAAQQAAAQAYQQAMMAYSTAGSQIGGDGGGGPAPLNPMMTGGSMAMGGFDPRMSMMGMPMMGQGMGMGPGMNQGMSPGMSPGMNPGMGMGGMSNMGGMGMNPLGMQMTGGSAFDSRFPPTFDSAQRPPSDIGGSGPRPYSSQNSSAGGQGSPAGPRPTDGGDGRHGAASGPSANGR
ncbi:hypothetical protein OBBRIDRAFT_788219 [Obba rivulosa]|uniref:PH domain-containing protein n=1 Tax=Obba rivulosa TaxID=1052685 RepID=A0A8E2J5Q8_9APHY|nr:hypothetical protein OBBRIDRAFT_788219 [Obba rivulosa]